ncbi:hypothetical protein ACP3V5_24655 [Vibrio maritimus]|uniref:HEAT repeat domain-containing protein n=1 Tax=Vibrio chaetopteri TaxID=3016528 RepID=A0AAU8BIQ6_9VIBR
MLQGWLASLLLVLVVSFSQPVHASKEMTQQEVERWLQSQVVLQKVDDFLLLVEQDDTDGLKFALNRLALPQQEVARFLLLKHIEDNERILSPKMAIFVQGQKSLPPTYTMLERGDGYEFSIPAFNYPAISARLIKRWNSDQKTLEFILQAESEQLVLRDWLSEGSDYERKIREDLLVKEFDSLSPKANAFISQQLTDTNITEWLPSTRVLVRMAQVNEDAALYDLLWKMRADYHSQVELERLASLSSPFAQQQIMAAARNPSLKRQAITELAQITPLPNEVKTFLVTRMTKVEDASFVASQLAQNGHGGWVRDVLSTNSQVKASLVLQALSN